MSEDIRWKQRLENFDKALDKLLSFAQQEKESPVDIHQVALIGAFEFTFELAWKTLKDYLDFGGVQVSIPREVIKQSFHHGLIEDGEVWIKMMEDRNIMSHVYDEKKAYAAIQSIHAFYISAIVQVHEFLHSKL